MPKIDINIQEARALKELMNDAKVPIPLGYILGNFMAKIEKSFDEEQQKKLKEKFSPSTKKSKCVE